LVRILVAVLGAVVLGGCTSLGSVPSSDYDVTVVNGTLLDLRIRLNGVFREGVSAAESSTTVPAARLGTLPWRLEAVTSSGRVIADMTVAPGSVGCVEGPERSRSRSGVVRVVDLSCGRLVIYAAPEAPPLPAPVPGAGAPGDCDP
jgi:hypothetical protein